MLEIPNQSMDAVGLKSIVESRPRLDSIIDRADRLRLFGVRYRPYWIMSDAAAVSAIVYAWAFSVAFTTCLV